MKKALSLIIAALMILSALTVFVSAAGEIDYASKNDGDVLYEVNFNGDDTYKPFNFRNGAAKMAATTIEVQDGGKTLVATAPSSAGSAYFWGGKINGLKIGGGRKYTITFKAAFPTGNAGVYFNFADIANSETYDPLKDLTYNGIYGLYGQIKSGNCMTLSYAAGGKLNGLKKVSQSGAYSPVPEGVVNDADGFVDVTIKVNDDFFSVWFNDKLYDEQYVPQSAIEFCPELGFSIYLYNNSAKFTVKDVVIKKGCDAEKTPAHESTLDYNSFNLGDKITDLVFNATSGPFVADVMQEAKAGSVSREISADGKTITVTDNAGDVGAHWFGGIIGNLRITDSTKYTFTYKLKDTFEATTYTGCVAYNTLPAAPGINRYNWYGRWVANEAPAAKFAYNGTNFTDYNYGDANMAVFKEVKPVLDAEGYTDIAVELNGWTWTIYMKDQNKEGALVPIQTVDVKALADAQGRPAVTGDYLSFIIYTYNKSLTFSVKDAAVFKGLTVSETYEPAQQGGNPTTGDATIWVVIVGAVALFGMGVAIKARKA